ncbi:hypothetical protein FNF29_04217 [Cafeteria roenbergensis]|uniref:Thymidylate kinase n=1 Tax=Cafeteria roenbergensis TaxID=33653 RepID=A0A5A8CGB9_CAFRO|nr:hypothetical protein FNF29_04217 [Cafeteria roenbergensis]|eukprot:KAA0152103.1 hypothetical protein FNF29_04217 [Cafeteria roenbergensis]
MFRTAVMRIARSLAIGAASLSPAALPVWCVPKAAASGAAVPPESASRGALIVFEGVDRSGKTTQARLLAERLSQNGVKAKFICFPDRSTAIGKVINAYLTNAKELDDRCIHLLFSANRWEAAAALTAALKNGETVVVDRYAYSGIAFSVAKGRPGMGLEWCAAPDAGLPQPDKVLFMRIPEAAATSRGGFGEERYEKAAFQDRVRSAFGSLRTGIAAGIRADGAEGGIWEDIDAVGSIEEVAARVMGAAMPAVKWAADGAPLRELWADDGSANSNSTERA